MANFLRQKYKEKPQAWGPVESVQRSVLINAEKLGIPAPQRYFPLWENAGSKVIDLMNIDTVNTFTLPNWKNNSAYFSAYNSDQYITLSKGKEILRSSKFAIIVSGKLNPDRVLSQTEQIFYERGESNTYSLTIFRDSYTNYITTVANYYYNFLYFSSPASTEFLPMSTGIIQTASNYRAGYYNGSMISSNTATYGVCNSYDYTFIGRGSSAATGWHGEAYGLIMWRNNIPSESQFKELTSRSNPYQLLQRQGDVYFSIPVSAGGIYFLRSLIMTMSNQSVTSEIQASIARLLQLAILNNTSSSDIAVSILRSLSANITNQTLTSDINILLANLIQFGMTISNSTALSDIIGRITRGLTVNPTNDTDTSDIDYSISRAFITNISNSTDLSDIDAQILRSLSASITNQTVTPDTLRLIMGVIGSLINLSSVVSANQYTGTVSSPLYSANISTNQYTGVISNG